jgi:hypothetical protein
MEALKNFTYRALDVSPPRHHVPSLLHPIKGAKSLTIRRRIHSPPYFLVSLAQEPALTGAEVATATTPHRPTTSVALPP